MEKKIKVALVSVHFAEYACRLAIALSERCEVLLVLHQDNANAELDQQLGRALEGSSVNTYYVNKVNGVLECLSCATRIAQVIRNVHPDIIHCQDSYRDAVVLGLWLLRIAPRVITIHDPEPHIGGDSRDQGFRTKVYRAFAHNWPTAAIVHGRYLRERLEIVAPSLKGKVNVVPHGPLGSLGKYNRRESRPPRLLFFGRMEVYKGLKGFVDAVIQLNDRGIDVVGVVAGSGPELSKNFKRMEASGHFIVEEGYISPENIQIKFEDAEAVVLPYLEATQSGVAAMALGFGVPVIATNVGSVCELVHHGVNGLLVESGDAHALELAMESVILDRDLRSRLAAGAEFLRDGSLSWKVVANLTVDVYKAIISHDKAT